MRWILLTSIVLMLATGGRVMWAQTKPSGLSVHWQKDLNYQPSELFPITIGKHGFPYVPVLVNGQEVNMAWDTGNMSGLHFTSDVAKRLGLPVTGESKHYGSDGKLIGTMRTYNVREMQVFGEMRKDEKAHENRRNDVDGYIGPRFVLGKRFTLDYQNKIMAVSKSPLPKQASAGAVLPMVTSPHHRGLILVWGSVNGKEVLIEVDTGKSRTSVDSALATPLGLPKTTKGFRIDEVKLGSYSFAVRSAKEVSFKGISQGLPEPIMLGVGSDVLSQVVLSVDYAQQIVMLTR